MAVVPNVLVVDPAVPVTSLRELNALAKSRPGTLNFASAGNGTTQHLSGELFEVMARVKGAPGRAGLACIASFSIHRSSIRSCASGRLQ